MKFSEWSFVVWIFEWRFHPFVFCLSTLCEREAELRITMKSKFKVDLPRRFLYGVLSVESKADIRLGCLGNHSIAWGLDPHLKWAWQIDLVPDVPSGKHNSSSTKMRPCALSASWNAAHSRGNCWGELMACSSRNDLEAILWRRRRR